MPVAARHLRFPRIRALHPRTRPAYVHLRNLLTDAKRGRAARVVGYVALPALIAAYRELMATLVRRLRAIGVRSAADVAEHARSQPASRHPALDTFARLPDVLNAESLLAEVARPRRHLFQAAGLFDALPGSIPW